MGKLTKAARCAKGTEGIPRYAQVAHFHRDEFDTRPCPFVDPDCVWTGNIFRRGRDRATRGIIRDALEQRFDFLVSDGDASALHIAKLPGFAAAMDQSATGHSG